MMTSPLGRVIIFCVVSLRRWASENFWPRPLLSADALLVILRLTYLNTRVFDLQNRNVNGRAFFVREREAV